MILKRLSALVFVTIALLSFPKASFAMTQAQMQQMQAMGIPVFSIWYSDDKSSMAVFASNSGPRTYVCAVQAKLRIAGQKAIENFSCRFTLGPNTKDRKVCERKGTGPGYFTQDVPLSGSCSPR